MPLTPTSCSASFTSSSLNGLIIASIFFTLVFPLGSSHRLQSGPGQACLVRSPSSRCGVPPSCTNQEPCQLPNRGLSAGMSAQGCGADQGVSREVGRGSCRERGWTYV